MTTSVLITGAANGMGLAIARALAQDGCALHLAGPERGPLKETAEALRAEFDCDIDLHVCDARQWINAEVLGLECDDVDVLIAAEGHVPGGAYDGLTHEDWQSAWQTRVFGGLTVAREIADGMVANEAGLIITLIDGDADSAADKAIYATAANAAIASFTQHLAVTLQEHGVSVVGVTTTSDDAQSARHIADVVMQRTAFATGDILKISG